MATMADKRVGVEGEVWKWRRKLFAWEEEQLRECCEFLHNIVLHANVFARWL